MRSYVVLYGLALAARVAVLLSTGPVRSPDSFGYRAAAAAIAADPLTSSPTFLELPPLFPLVLALFPDDRAAVAAQAAVGALVAPLAAAIAARYGRVALWSAGLAAAFSPHFLQWTPYLLTDTFGVVLLLATAWRSAIALDGRVRDAVFAGFVGGAAILARAATLAVVAVLAVGQATTRPARARRLAGFAAAAALVLAIPTARNALAVGELRPYRDQGLFQVWAGTTWNERGRGTGGVDIVFPPGYEDWSRDRRDQFHRTAIAATLRERPFDYAALAVKKAFWFWLPVYPEWSLTHKLVSGAYLGTLYVLAAIGLLSARRSAIAVHLAVCIGALTALAAITIVDFDARYRLPAEALLLPLAGAGAAAIVRRMRPVRDAPAATTA